MSDLQKRIVYSVLSAVATALVAYLEPQFREPALAVFTFAMGKLHFTKPGDVKPEVHEAEIRGAIVEALSSKVE